MKHPFCAQYFIPPHHQKMFENVEDLGIFGVLKKQNGRCGPNSSDSGQGPVVGCCHRGKEPLGFIQCREFIDWQRNY
jgi:hypothetical protein